MGQIYFTQPWKQERDSVSMDIKEIFQKEDVWMVGGKPQLFTTLATKWYHYFHHVYSGFYVR